MRPVLRCRSSASSRVVYWTDGRCRHARARATVIADIESLRDDLRERRPDGGSAMRSTQRTGPTASATASTSWHDPTSSRSPATSGAGRTARKTNGAWIRFEIESRAQFGDREPHCAEAKALPLRRRLPPAGRARHPHSGAVPGSHHQAPSSPRWSGDRRPGAVVGGLIMSRAILGRIDAINQAAERIMHGERRSAACRCAAATTSSTGCRKTSTAMLDEIERLLGSIRAVTDNIAHDLRSPLNRLRNRLETALGESDPAGAPRDHRAGDRARPTTCWRPSTPCCRSPMPRPGTSRGNLLPVDLVALSHDVAELYEPLVEEQGLGTWRSRSPGRPPSPAIASCCSRPSAT